MLRTSHILGEAGVSLVNLNAEAGAPPRAWSPRVLERSGGDNFRVLHMDGMPYPNEVHGYAERLLVTDGQLCLRIGDGAVTVSRGELYVMPVGVPYSVNAGSAGVLVTLDA